MKPTRMIMLGFCLGGIWVSWSAYRTRTTTIDFDDRALSFTYSVTWGWGMEEAISVRWGPMPWQAATVESEIWKKPYWSGALIYKTDDGKYYDIKLGARGTGQLIRFLPATRKLIGLSICDAINKNRAFSKEMHLNGSRYFSGRKFLGEFRINGASRGEGVEFVAHDKMTEEPPLDNGECP